MPLSLQVKAAFTRAYNKESHLTPYSLQSVKKGRRGAVDADLALDPDSDLQEEEEEENLNMDAMVKVNYKTPILGSLFINFVMVDIHYLFILFFLKREDVQISVSAV